MEDCWGLRTMETKNYARELNMDREHERRRPLQIIKTVGLIILSSSINGSLSWLHPAVCRSEPCVCEVMVGVYEHVGPEAVESWERLELTKSVSWAILHPNIIPLPDSMYTFNSSWFIFLQISHIYDNGRSAPAVRVVTYSGPIFVPSANLVPSAV